MSNLNKLCYVKNGSALAYKKNGSALIYKGNGSEVTVRVPWTPQSYTCNTYSAYHEITFSCSGSFTSGSGSIVSQTSGGTETVFKIKVSDGPAVFCVRTACSSPCTAKTEDPGVTCKVFANQQGSTPRVKSNVPAPRTESGSAAASTYISFDSDRKLTGVS